MRVSTSLVIIAVLLLRPLAAAAQPPLTSEAEVAAFKQMAAGIPLGTRVVVRTKEGRRLRATLMAVEEERIVIKRDSRVSEPAVEVAFADLARLERDSKGGFSFVKALGIGLAAGVGAILTLFAIAVSIDD
jgi:hypothetical protein